MHVRSSLLLSFLLAAPAVAQSDDCAAPPAIVGTGTFTFSLSTATSSGFDGGGAPCVATAGPDAFWTWTAPSNGTFVFSLCNSGFDSSLSVHAGSDCSATCATFDGTGCGVNGVVERTVVIGETLLLQMGREVLFGTAGQLEIVEVPATAPFDTCATPDPISGVGTFPYQRDGYTGSGFDGGDPIECSQGQVGTLDRDHFFVWTATEAGSFRFTYCDEEANIRASVYAGDDCSATCLDGSLTSSCSPQAEDMVVHGVLVDDVFLLQVGDWETPALEPADGTLVVATTDPPPANDDCSTPEVLSGTGAFVFDSSSATRSGFDGNGNVPCDGVDHNRDLFFLWTAPADGDWQFDTVGTVANTRMALYDGVDCSATCLDFDEDGSGGLAPLIVLPGLTAGTDVLVQVGGWNELSVGPGTLNIGMVQPPPTNDSCDVAEPISGVGSWPYTTLGTTSTVFGAADPNCLPGFSGLPLFNDLFYQWTATANGTYRFRLSGVDSAMNVHTGTGCAAVCLDNDTGAATVDVSNVQAGDTLLIQVGATFTGPSVDTLVVECLAGCGSPIQLLCDPAAPHFGGASVTLGNSTVPLTPTTAVHVDASGGPPNQFGFVLVSGALNVGTPVFNGLLCLDLPIGRYNSGVATNQGLPTLDSLGQFDANGDFVNIAGTAPSTGGFGFDVPYELPFAPAGQVIQSGDTWYFQVWYRDQIVTPGDSANFSNVLQVDVP